MSQARRLSQSKRKARRLRRATAESSRTSLRWETLLKWLIFYSIAMYVLEMSTGSGHSREGSTVFLWSERVVAIVFTVEYVVRWQYATNKLRYPVTAMGIVDLIAIVPFYAGFFVGAETLHLIRTLRVLRLLKCFRYSKALRWLGIGFYRARAQLQALGFALLIVLLFSVSVMFECERKAQPEAFSTWFDSLWFTCVTVTTVGYGDMSPKTTGGRIVAMGTFIYGVVLFTTVAGVMSSSFTAVLHEQLELDEPA